LASSHRFGPGPPGPGALTSHTYPENVMVFTFKPPYI
jgi:hypothetical protein